jgi:hypothetical protein
MSGTGDEYDEWSETPLSFDIDSMSASDLDKLEGWITDLAAATLDAAASASVSLFPESFVRDNTTRYELAGACLRSTTEGRKGKKKVPVWLKVSVYNPPDVQLADEASTSRTAQSERAPAMQTIQEE